MRARQLLAPAGVFLLTALWGAAPVAALGIRIGGTGGATALMVHLGTVFTAQTGIAVEVIPGMGSGGGISATADGVLDIAVSGRPLAAAELARGLVPAFTVRTPYVLAASRPSATAMTEQAIIDAYRKERTTWPDGSPIKVILRPRSESDNASLVALFPGMTAALEEARKRTELPVTATDQDNADLAEALPGSLIGATYTQVTMEARKLQLVAINGIAPNIEAFENGTYHYTKVLLVIRQQRPGDAATRFIAFMQTEQGIKAMREAGCLPGVE
jgi:phosphate transport system substrate-binding protein